MKLFSISGTRNSLYWHNLFIVKGALSRWSRRKTNRVTRKTLKILAKPQMWDLVDLLSTIQNPSLATNQQPYHVLVSIARWENVYLLILSNKNILAIINYKMAINRSMICNWSPLKKMIKMAGQMITIFLKIKQAVKNEFIHVYDIE